jgi:hypothetical protein
MAGGAKIKKAAKKIKGLISSSKGDANASLSDKFGIGRSFSNKFDQRLQDGLSDLLGGALGIKMSKVPEISGAVLDAKEKARLKRQAAVTKGSRAAGTPGTQVTLQFPINYFIGIEEEPTDRQGAGTRGTLGDGTTTLNFPNSIHFRTLARKQQDHSEEAVGPRDKLTENMGGSADDMKRNWNKDIGAHGSVNPADETIYDIFLHLPEKLSDEVKVEYSEASAGAMQQFFAKMFGGDDVEGMSGERNFDMNEILTMFKGMMPGGEIMQKAAGHMTNPMVFQTLKNVNFRSYNYSFTLKPTSPAEAEMIKAIVFAFKKSMLPGTAGENNMIWTLPNEWAIQFQGPIRDWVDFPLTAVCTGATVDYSQYLMAGDKGGKGDGAPSSITLALSFIETGQLSRQKFSAQVGAGNSNRKSLADEGTKLGALDNLSDEQIKQIQGGSTEGGNHGS